MLPPNELGVGASDCPNTRLPNIPPWDDTWAAIIRGSHRPNARTTMNVRIQLFIDIFIDTSIQPRGLPLYRTHHY
jgi:hypothetical protein